MTDTDSQARKRERQEPEELHNPVPKPLAMLAVGLVAWGVWYYFQNVGFPADAGDRRSVIIIDPAASIDGAVVYAGNCVACHQPAGTGLAGVFPPLAGSEWPQAAKKDIPIQILLHGINGSITVKGATYAGVMPAFAQLKDAEIAAVLSHVRKSWGNTANPVSAEEVAAQRKRFPDRTDAWQGGKEIADTVGTP